MEGEAVGEFSGGLVMTCTFFSTMPQLGRLIDQRSTGCKIHGLPVTLRVASDRRVCMESVEKSRLIWE